MSWLCSVCECNNADPNEQCVYCYRRNGVVTLRPFKDYEVYDIYDYLLFKCRAWMLDRHLPFILVNNISKIISGEIKRMTPQEQLFAEFFNNEKSVITEMSLLELRAHREELAKIAFEARARLTAVDDEERTRKAKNKKETGPTGFATSLHTDEITSDAINKVKQRQKKLDKSEKLVQQMMRTGMDRKTAESLMSAGTILGRIKKIDEKNGKSTDNGDNDREPVTPVDNPFAKKVKSDDNKEENKPKTEISINEETNTVIIREEKKESSKGFNNPFDKKG